MFEEDGHRVPPFLHLALAEADFLAESLVLLYRSQILQGAPEGTGAVEGGGAVEFGGIAFRGGRIGSG